MRKILVLLLLIFSTTFVYTQNNFQDVVYLKNGSIIHGTIIELVPQKSVKIKTSNGNVFVYKMEKVKKLTKETKKTNLDNKSNSSTQTKQFKNKKLLDREGKYYFQGKNKIPKDELLRKLATNEKAYAVYESRKGYYITGGIILGLSAAYLFLNDGALRYVIFWIGWIGGGSIVVVGSHRIVKAIKIYNNSITGLSLNIQSTYDGIGLSLNF